MNLTDSSGNVTMNYRYGVFGDLRFKYGAVSTDRLFAGEQRDSETGYDYLRARLYDPATGRFLSQDPLGGGYPYAGGNPVNRRDPTGLYYIGGYDEAYGGIVEFDSTEVGLSPCDIYGHCYIWSTSGILELDPADFAPPHQASGANELADAVATAVVDPCTGVCGGGGGGCGFLGCAVSSVIELAAEVPYGVYYVAYEILGADIPGTPIPVCLVAAICAGLVVTQAVGAYTHAAMDTLAGHPVDTDGDVDSLTNPFYHGDESGCWFPCVLTPGFHPGWTWSDPFHNLDFNWP